ncbi:hypothetical protein B0J11DRAFT_423997 [Dendryphion nanum]|uniref:Uncharacterized protein n=1 Tax=Dendryphion nanum TaxID=256645 RepID=A0A9P9J2M7_9PLEO|nr:hypothetical protein B0J11DRAFT_423997 [Dendryphion nanum]
MPVTGLRARDGLVDYIVVRRSGLVRKEEGDDSEAAFDSTPTLDGALDSSAQRRQLDPSTFDIDIGIDRDEVKAQGYDSDDDDDKPRPSQTGPPSVRVTMTMPQAQQTGSSALASNDPETVVVEFPPPPPPKQRGGISQTTEHLLIAAGSIGATIIIVMVILGIYTMRKRGLSFSEATRQAKNNIMGRRPDPPPKQASGWMDNKRPYRDDYGSMRNDTVTPPQQAATIGRSGSISSQRPLMALQRSNSFNDRQISDRSVSPEQQSTFLLDSPPPSRNNSHRRDVSNTPSSPVLPLQNQRRSVSTHNTRSMSEVSELRYPDPVPERDMSPLPPPPTFKQFLSNRPSASQKNSGFHNMASRFSWTNSNAPQTPHDPSRDTATQVYGRESFMTQRSSVPRFRTVDSWVNQQANRVEVQKLKDQYRLTQTSTVYSGDDDRDSAPSVPQIPRHLSQQQGYTPSHVRNASEGRTPLTPPLQPRMGGLPGRNIKHERHDTRTTVDTAPIFRHHPGTEVRFSTRSMVPSEVLDMGPRPNVLS